MASATITEHDGWLQDERGNRNRISYYGSRKAAEKHVRETATELLIEHEVRESDLVMLRKAIEAGDPRAELFVRIDDMLRETRAVITKARGQ